MPRASAQSHSSHAARLSLDIPRAAPRTHADARRLAGSHLAASGCRPWFRLRVHQRVRGADWAAADFAHAGGALSVSASSSRRYPNTRIQLGPSTRRALAHWLLPQEDLHRDGVEWEASSTFHSAVLWRSFTASASSLSSLALPALHRAMQRRRHSLFDELVRHLDVLKSQAPEYLAILEGNRVRVCRL